MVPREGKKKKSWLSLPLSLSVRNKRRGLSIWGEEGLQFASSYILAFFSDRQTNRQTDRLKVPPPKKLRKTFFSFFSFSRPGGPRRVRHVPHPPLVHPRPGHHAVLPLCHNQGWYPTTNGGVQKWKLMSTSYTVFFLHVWHRF